MQHQMGAQPGQPSYYQGAPAELEYINVPKFGQGSTYQLIGVTGLADQFSQMNMGHKGLRLVTTNLLTAPPEPLELHQLPPDIILPPNSSLSNSPFANTDPSYQTSGACSTQSLPPNRYSISPRFPLAS